MGNADWGCAAGEEGEGGGCGMRWARPAREREEAKCGSRASSSTISDLVEVGGWVWGEGWTCAAGGADGDVLGCDGIWACACALACEGDGAVVVDKVVDG